MYHLSQQTLKSQQAESFFHFILDLADLAVIDWINLSFELIKQWNVITLKR